jgi:hypothetical protein
MKDLYILIQCNELSLTDAYGCIDITEPSWTSIASMTAADMRLTTCLQFCRSRDLEFSSIQNTDCHCFTSLPDHLNVTWSQCDIPCPGHAYQQCGGSGGNYLAMVIKGTVYSKGEGG